MLIREYRIVMPLSVEEYQLGQLWGTIEMSKQNTGGGEGVTIERNEPFGPNDIERPFKGVYDRGQYTHKIYNLESRIPRMFRILLSRDKLKRIAKNTEKAWNAYPYCYTDIANPEYMKEGFYIHIESIHLPDRGTTENALQLSPDLLKQREVVHLDIRDDKYLTKQDAPANSSLHPSNFHSPATDRGPLGPFWQETNDPIMCCYKLVTVHFKWNLLQKRVENYIQNTYPRLFTKFHRDIFCSIDKWKHLTLDKIREIENEAKDQLNQQKNKGAIRGMKDMSTRSDVK